MPTHNGPLCIKRLRKIMHDSNRLHTTFQTRPDQTRTEQSPLIDDHSDEELVFKSPTCVLNPATCCICRDWSLNPKDNQYSLGESLFYFFILPMQAVLKQRRSTEFMCQEHCVFVQSWSAVIAQQDATEGWTACKQKTEYADKRLSLVAWVCFCRYFCPTCLDKMFSW